MQFNNHFNLVGKHAFLSASKYAWIRYTDEKLDETYRNHAAHALGTRLHEFAKSAIELGIRMPRNSKTLNSFVNDALGYRMQPEQILFYSDYVFGTADAISFRRERGHEQEVLRISDLKTGVTKASFDQLLIYTAIFCLEYGIKPAFIDVELKLYQNDEVLLMIPDLEDILQIMGTIVRFNKRIEQLKLEELEG